MRTRVLSTVLLTAALGCSSEQTVSKTAEQAAPTSRAETPVSVGADPGWKVEQVRSPASFSSVSPQLTVQSGRAILSWLVLNQSRTSLQFAERTSTGWSAARTVFEGDDLIVNTADVPSVVALADGTLAAHWLQRDGSDPEAYKLPLSWSKDSGKTWSAPVYPASRRQAGSTWLCLAVSGSGSRSWSGVARW